MKTWKVDKESENKQLDHTKMVALPFGSLSGTLIQHLNYNGKLIKRF